jgi:hypothetical protein
MDGAPVVTCMNAFRWTAVDAGLFPDTVEVTG